MPNTITRLDTFIKLQDLSKGHYSDEGVRTYQRLLALRDKWKNRALDNAFPQSDDLKNRLIASGTTVSVNGLIDCPSGIITPCYVSCFKSPVFSFVDVFSCPCQILNPHMMSNNFFHAHFCLLPWHALIPPGKILFPL